MRVFVAGAEGFIGRFIVTALEAAGHAVVAGVHRASIDDGYSISCDFGRDLAPATWAARLAGIDAVVNAVGILREGGRNSFERIHVQGPKALFEGCALGGIKRVIQISALGNPEIGEYLASKHRGDAELAKLDLDWTIFRPSLVYSVSGSYGGTSLLRAMAALPGFILVPGTGNQELQPIRAEDLAFAVVHVIANGQGTRQIIDAVGPDKVTLLQFLQALRRWLELPRATVLHIPSRLAYLGSWLGQHLSNGPVSLTMWRMMEQSNVASTEATAQFFQFSGVAPWSIGPAFAAVPSFVQDRWHAKLYFLAPALRLSIAALWITSAIVGFVTPLSQAAAQFEVVGLSSYWVAALQVTGSAVDLILGLLALVAWRIEWVATFMCLSLLAYTAFIGALFPSVWLEPFGGLIKNLPLIPAVLVMGVLSRRR